MSVLSKIFRKSSREAEDASHNQSRKSDQEKEPNESLPPYPPYPDDFIGEKVSLNPDEPLTYDRLPGEGPYCWLDRPDFHKVLQRKLETKTMTPFQAKMCQNMESQGYCILENPFEEGELDAIYSAYLKDIENGKIERKDGDPRSLNPHFHNKELRDLLHDPRITQWINLFLGRECIPFQTIISPVGSKQKDHSDAIHMTTYPIGYLAAAWIAFEDIHPDSGPLVYYPKSHKLPYHLSKSVGIEVQSFTQKGYQEYSRKYEPFIQNLLHENHLEPEYFLAKKGDILFWHHNLIHGGAPIKNPKATRKSVVCHYYSRGVLCYHDLAGVPSQIKTF